jgi:hypothetical protein
VPSNDAEPAAAAPAELHPASLGEAVAALEKPVRWMTLQELRDELERTRPAWDAEVADLDGVLAGGELSALSEDAHRHRWSRTSCCADRVRTDLDHSQAQDLGRPARDVRGGLPVLCFMSLP